MKYSKEDIKEWDELYQYVRSEIMGYDLTMALTNHMVLSLKQFRHGTVMANQHSDMKFAYTYKEVLLAFKFSKPAIMKAVDYKKGEFKNENAKFSYIVAIVRNNINDVKKMIEQKKASDKKIDGVDICNNVGASYKKKTKGFQVD